MCELIKLENNTLAFICNCKLKKDHQCDDDLSILILSNGDRIENTKINQERYMSQSIGESVACSICGHASIDDAYWLNI